MSIDLHCHTRISDGSTGIEELLAIARRKGITTVAVTDHDTTAAVNRAAVIGKRLGLEVIPGVEFSTWDPVRKRKVHLLAYLFDAPDRLEGICHQILRSRRAAADEMIRKVLRYYPIVADSILHCATGSTCIYKQHIMHALMNAGYAASIYGETYRQLFSADGGRAFVPVEYPDIRTVIDSVHSAGGVAVLAHPYLYRSEELMRELTAEGLLDGVEAWHPSQSAEQTEALVAFADENGLVATGGSDFHGMYAETIHPLGCSAPDTVCARLREQKRKRVSQ